MYRYLLLFTLLISNHVFAQTALLDIKDAWIQEGPPNARVLAGFMHITNISDDIVTITEAHSDAFKHIEFHRSLIENGMARMQYQPHLHIRPHHKLEMKAGGYHLMMMQTTRALKAGDKVQLLLKTGAGIDIPVTMTVKRPE